MRTTISNLNLRDCISCIIDSSDKKQGTFSPASGLPILHPNTLKNGMIKKVLVIAAGYNEEIIQTLKTNFSKEIDIAQVNQGVVINVSQ